MAEPLKTFIIYSSKDRDLRDEFLQHLRPLARAGKIRVWSDAEIPPGEPWNAEIEEKLHETELFIPLVSKNFFNSEYIETIELPFAEQQRKAGNAFVIPVLLRPCGYKHDPVIGQLEVIPKDKPIVSEHWKDTDLAWEHVIDKISGRAAQILLDDDFLKKRAAILEGKMAVLEEKRRVAEEAERKRLAAEKAERERVVREKVEAEKRERKEAEHQRLATEKAEKERVAREKEEAELKKYGLGLEMVEVKGGTFKMGDEHGDLWSACHPVHQVTVSDFKIGKYLVTQKLWMEIMGENPSYFKGSDLPVEQVSWDDCQIFLKKLNERFPGRNFRLPTEAEWEFAARGGKQSNGFKFSGSNSVDEVAWYKENSGLKNHSVGKKKANELGIYDMSGYVWEWCQDVWHNDYNGAPIDSTAWLDDGNFSRRCLRGGSWGDYDVLCRIASRDGNEVSLKDYDNGIRLAHD